MKEARYYGFAKPNALSAAGRAAATAALIVSLPIRAQSTPKEIDSSSPKLEEVVVTSDSRSYDTEFVQAGSFRGARQLDTPLTVNVITNAQIESQQAQGLLDALRDIAGVSPSQTSTTVYSNIAIRGINVENRGNYRLNGSLPIINLIDLPLEDKERVEALKGASALYYGFTTPAGIINLTMKRPTPTPYIGATLFGNDYGALGGHIDAGNTWGRFGMRINALYGGVDSGIDNTHGHRSLLAATFDFKPIDSVALSLDVEQILKRVNEPGIFRYMRIPTSTLANPYPTLQLPPLLDPHTNFGPDWAENRAKESNILFNAIWRISPAWELSASYGNSHLVRDRRFSTIDLDKYGAETTGTGLLTIGQQPAATFDNSNYRVEIAGAINIWFMKHQLLVGTSRNIRDAFNSTNVPATCPGATPSAARVTCTQNVFNPVDIPETRFPARTGTQTRIDDLGVYLFDRIEMTRWLQILTGVRKTDYKESSLDSGAITFKDQPTSVSYGLVVKPLHSISIYSTYIEGLESTPAAPISAANFGSTLPATKSTQREFGFKFEPHAGLLLQAAYFNIERDSAFVNGANLYVLDGRARFRGMEFSMTGEVAPDWSLYFTGQFLDAKQKSGADTRLVKNAVTNVVTVIPTVVGRRIENTPERTLSVVSEYRLSGLLSGFSANAGAYYLSQRAVNALNQAFIPGYSLFDLGAAYTGSFSGFPTTIRVTDLNIAHKKYFSSTGSGIVAEGPPGMVKFSVTMRF